MKILVCSDNHYNKEALDIILRNHPDCDYYWHLGDSEAESEKEISPFLSVKGNNDWNNVFPKFRVLKAHNHTFLLIHGDGYIYNMNNLIDLAKSRNCDTILYGHTHIYNDIIYKNIRLINPGSCSYNRNGDGPTYCLITFDNDNNIVANKMFIDNDPEFFYT